MNDPKGLFEMKFVGRPGGKLMKGAPGNYDHGTVYKLPFRHSRRPYWQLLEPVPDFVVPEITEDDDIFVNLDVPHEYSDDAVFMGAVLPPGVDDDALVTDKQVAELDKMGINLDSNTDATIEPYMHYSPSTNKLSEYTLSTKELDEEIVELEPIEGESHTAEFETLTVKVEPNKPDRDELKHILTEAGIVFKPGMRTTTLQKLVDGLDAEE